MFVNNKPSIDKSDVARFRPQFLELRVPRRCLLEHRHALSAMALLICESGGEEMWST